MRADHALDRDASASALDSDFHAHADITFAVLVADVRDAASASDRAVGTGELVSLRLPFHHGRRALDNFDCARILQAPQAEFDRIDTGRGRKFINETFDRKAIRRLAWRADWRRT